MLIQIANIISLLNVTLLLLIIIGTYAYKNIYSNSYVISILYVVVSMYFMYNTVLFVLLIITHIQSDVSVVNAFTNTHSTQPILYRIIGLWGNHEGSMLLWEWILSLYTYTILFLRKLPIQLLKHTVLAQSILNMFFLLFIITTSSPYLQIIYNRILEGTELSPILQDIVLSIHPPLVYAGYIGLSVPLSITIGYLRTYSIHIKQWIYYIQLYNTISWSFLTIGIFLGSWWAYYELGWGGWWFWDPVENASLMPWILSTSLMHSIQATKKTHVLAKWTVILATLCFYSSIIGTFFVRSGFLDSVHSFTSDTHRGYYILTILIILCLYLIYVYITYSKYIELKYTYSLFSKEGLILLNQFYFVSFYLIVAIGTFYPIVYNTLSNKSITIGPSFYNQALIPITLPFILLLSYTSYINWYGVRDINPIKKEDLRRSVLYFIGINIGIISLMFIINYNGPIVLYIYLPSLTLALLYIIIGIIKKHKQWSAGATLGHIGVIVLLLSITLWYVNNEEKHLIMHPGDQVAINDNAYILRGVDVIRGPNYESYYASFLVCKSNEVIGVLFPEKKYYYVQDFYASKVDINSNILQDLHAIIGNGGTHSGWEISIYLYSNMSWIWFSSVFMVTGAILTLLHKKRKKHRETWL
jgi:cytochrome c-type biogenesis protein CcmF